MKCWWHYDMLRLQPVRYLSAWVATHQIHFNFQFNVNEKSDDTKFSQRSDFFAMNFNWNFIRNIFMKFSRIVLTWTILLNLFFLMSCSCRVSQQTCYLSIWTQFTTHLICPHGRLDMIVCRQQCCSNCRGKSRANFSFFISIFHFFIRPRRE